MNKVLIILAWLCITAGVSMAQPGSGAGGYGSVGPGGGGGGPTNGITSGTATNIATFQVTSLITNLPFIIITNGSATATIQSQLNAATSGGRVVFQTGSYAITNSLLITNNNIDFDGNGATLTYSTGLTNAMVYATNANRHVRVHGFTFNGGAVQAYNTASYSNTLNGVAVPYYSPYWTNRTGLRIDASGGAEVDHNIVTGWSGNGIFGVQLGGTLSAQSTNKLSVHDNTLFFNFAGIYIPGATYEWPGYYNSDSSIWIGTNNAEYAQVFHNTTYGNQFGIVATAGNVEVQNNNCDDFIGLAAFSGINPQHGSYQNNTFNHSTYGSYFEGGGNGGIFTGNRYMAASRIFFTGVTSIQFEHNKLAQADLIFTNGCTGDIAYNQFQLGTVWGVGIKTNFTGSPSLIVGCNIEEGGTNTDGSPAALILKSGNGSGLTNLSGSTVQSGTLPITAADTSWMSVTNAIAGTNQPMTAGQALVVVGTNANGATMVKGTNWPSGGSTPNGLVTNAGPVDITVVYGGLTTTITSNNVTSATITANGGTVSIIPTNGAPVNTTAGLTGSLPFGLTNTLAGRAQYLVGYYIVDAVGGTPVLTVSNELDGYKYPIISRGASASITPETNWFTTPIISTNTVLRIRDESTGSGASVGLVSSKQIGL